MDLVTATVFSPGSGPVKARTDQTLIVPRLGLLAMADSPTEGEQRQAGIRIALDTIRRGIEQHDDIIARYRRHPTGELRERILTLLEDALARASHEVFAYGRRFDHLQVTADVVLLLDHEAFVAHVGDGRVYLVRRGLVHQLTVDHEQGRDGVFAEPEIEGDDDDEPVHPSRQLARALGPSPQVEVESLCMELTEHDRFALLGWGVHTAVPEGVLHHHLLRDDLDEFGDGLSRAAPEAPLIGVCGQLGGSEPDFYDGGRSRLAILAPIPLFAHCTDRELRAVASATHPRRFPEGTVLFQQGDPGTAMYLVLSGEVRIERDGRELVTLGPGSNFGEMAMLDQPSRSATAITESDCELMVISRESFFALLKGNPMLAVKILWNMALRLSSNLRATSAALAEAKRERMQEESLEAATEAAQHVAAALATGAPPRRHGEE